MSFLERLSDVGKPNVDNITFDFKFGDGPEKVFILDIPYATKQKLIGARMKKGRDAETGRTTFELDVTGDALYLDAEVIASTVCDEDGKLLFTTGKVKEWGGQLVRRLAKAIADKIDIFGVKDDEEVPSKGKSESGTPLP